MKSEIKELKQKVQEQDAIIERFEQRLAAMEGRQSSESQEDEQTNDGDDWRAAYLSPP